jgi:methionine--tRNA ligase beta chain
MKVSLEDFNKFDLRVGKVVKAEPIPGMKKILKAQIDVGEGRTVQTIIGGAEYYKPEYFIGRNVILLLNLAPKKIGGIESQGMLLAADIEGKPIWLTVDGDVNAGSKVR